TLAGALLELTPIVDDGAVFYLNGQEIYRLNMPDGTVSYSTSASTGVGDAVFSTPVIVPATGLVAGNNVLAVEVHQATAPSGGNGPAVTPGAGYSMAWDGSDGALFTPHNPAPVPENEGLTSHGTTPFGSSQYGSPHFIPNI